MQQAGPLSAIPYLLFYKIQGIIFKDSGDSCCICINVYFRSSDVDTYLYTDSLPILIFPLQQMWSTLTRWSALLHLLKLHECISVNKNR